MNIQKSLEELEARWGECAPVRIVRGIFEEGILRSPGVMRYFLEAADPADLWTRIYRVLAIMEHYAKRKGVNSLPALFQDSELYQSIKKEVEQDLDHRSAPYAKAGHTLH